MKYSHSKAMAVFYKIVKWVKNGVLMIIHIYAKVSNLKCSIMPAVLATGSISPSALSLAGHTAPKIYPYSNCC